MACRCTRTSTSSSSGVATSLPRSLQGSEDEEDDQNVGVREGDENENVLSFRNQLHTLGDEEDDGVGGVREGDENENVLSFRNQSYGQENEEDEVRNLEEEDLTGTCSCLAAREGPGQLGKHPHNVYS